MKLGLRIFGCYLVIFCVCFAVPVGWMLDTLRTRYLEGVEDPLVDQAHILAGVVGRMMADGRFDAARFYETFDAVYNRPLDVRIYHLAKTVVDPVVYITDAKGKVLFHSRDPDQVGADYRRWRDVSLTLDGAYGARTTLADPADPTSSMLVVAAPIMVDGALAGVLSVGKPTTNINSFLKLAKPRMIQVATLAVVMAVALGYLVALWITRPIKRMTDYALAVSDGRQAFFPRLDRTEIGTMGRALQKMQASLEGKAYVERYVQQLTHELKSPLSAIRASAELLEEAVPPERRRRFLTHIHTEAGRISDIVERMLTLSALENQPHLTKCEKVDLFGLVRDVIESKQSMIMAKNLSVMIDIDATTRIAGDAFWLRQAVANLIQNAIDFSRPGGVMAIGSTADDHAIRLRIDDSGTTIPDYALEKIFDKFYSLKRPDSGRKSTGLGLNLVKQVATLHGGDIILQNRSSGGVRAVLTLPTKRR
ncbi:sensor histidine kinase [Desulfosarcina ovata subsp. sediminis]|uniref:histidine kinase n=1 Tax=Desulfosarcina ovata subsp. sediminis TaxID=885957 RepID=A0A5K7ZVM2_9BACT|nr:two-component system sensor histidine kinase CreC [Desulfosarcina ovata]BBO84248.1 sensor histidine kinase [Desulfosarcina ovata subsp. sediminis]